jgi:hypothetical protein
MKLKYFEWSSKMSKTIKSLAVVALLATPTFASAESIAASLSASFGEFEGSVVVNSVDPLTQVNTPTSVSVSGAMGYTAVATSAATALSTTATSGASIEDGISPTATATYNDTSKAYETTVSFNPVFNAAAFCAGLTATQTGSTVDVDTATVTVVNNNGVTLNTTDNTLNVDDGAITINCAS